MLAYLLLNAPGTFSRNRQDLAGPDTADYITKQQFNSIQPGDIPCMVNAWNLIFVIPPANASHGHHSSLTLPDIRNHHNRIVSSIQIYGHAGSCCPAYKKRTISKVVPEFRIIPEIINAVILTVNLHI